MGKTHERDLEYLLGACVPWLQKGAYLLVEVPKWLWRVAKLVWLADQTERAEESTYANHPVYLDAVKFQKEGHEPKDDCDYTWAINYAKDCYNGLEETFRYLDDKADAIIKYLGGGTAVFTLASLVSLTYYSAWYPLLLLPSFVFSLRSLYLAVESRRPTTRPSPPSVMHAIKYAEYHGKKSEATFIALWHQCCEGLDLVNQAKAEKVNRASKYYFRAVFCLLIPLSVWPLCALKQPPPRPIPVEIRNAPR